MQHMLLTDVRWSAALLGLLVLSGAVATTFATPLTLDEGDNSDNLMKRGNWQSLQGAWGKRAADEKTAVNNDANCDTWLRQTLPHNDKSRYETELDELQPYGLGLPVLEPYEPQPDDAFFGEADRDDSLTGEPHKRSDALSGVDSHYATARFDGEQFVKQRREQALQDAAAAFDEQLLAAHRPMPETHVRFGYAAGKQPVAFLIKTIVFGDPQTLDAANDDITGEKRSWKSMNTAWGKRRNAADWNKFRGAWGKREPGWNNLKGMWGKRAGGNWQKFNGGWGKRDPKGVSN